MTQIFAGDVGTELTLDCGVDVSSATVRKIRAKMPGGRIKEWSATQSGTNSITYTTVEGDINVSGAWYLQAYIEMPGWKGRGDWSLLEVLR